MMTTLLQCVMLLAAGVILWRSETAINLMGPGCRIVTRVAFWLLAVGAVSAMIDIAEGYKPSLADALTSCGLAALLVSERRFKSLLRLRPSMPPSIERVTQ